MRTRIKFCGLGREADVDAAVAAGVDALGFVLWPGSQRAVSLERLEALSARVPPFIARVGLFVDQDAEFIAAAAPCLDLLQFHGEEPPQACAGFGTPWLKALRMRPGFDLEAAAQRYAGARGLLLDAWRPGVPGGTGETFDWARIPASLASRIVLAGGLDPANVGEAIARVRPYAVDVSGGIEAAPGRKDRQRMEAFVAAVASADRMSS